MQVIIDWVNSYMPKKNGRERKRMEGGAIIREVRRMRGMIIRSKRFPQVHDIEENIWMPALGLKGKIDVSLEVRLFIPVVEKSHIAPFLNLS